MTFSVALSCLHPSILFLDARRAHATRANALRIVSGEIGASGRLAVRTQGPHVQNKFH